MSTSLLTRRANLSVASSRCEIKPTQDGRLRRGAELEQEDGASFYLLLIPGPHRRISPSASARANVLHDGSVTISIASETPNFTFMPLMAAVPRKKKTGFREGDAAQTVGAGTISREPDR